MRPGSALPEELNRDICHTRHFVFRIDLDTLGSMILPAGSSFVPVGQSIRVLSLAHPLLVRDRRVLKLVLRILNE